MIEEYFSRRDFLRLSFAALAVAPLGKAFAESVDSISLAPGERVLGRSTLFVPGRTDKAGLVGADVFVPQRGWLTIAFSLEAELDITLMVLTPSQKAQVMSGQRLSGDPLARILIQGPETAQQTVSLDAGGSMYVAFVNSEPKGAEVAYRLSFKAF